MTPKIDFSGAERSFSKAMSSYTKLSSKTSEEAVNKAAKDVLVGNRAGGVTGVIALTPKADVKAVKARLNGPGRDGKGKLVYRLIDKRGKSRQEIKELARKFIARTASSVGYIKAGWYRAAQAFGGRGGRVSPKGFAAEGKGKRATESKPEATFENHSTGAVKISGPALSAAMESKRADLLRYVQKKLSDGWGKR